MKITIVVAVDQNRLIGRNNDLLYRLPEDLKRFKELTIGGVVLMGRKTFESIGKPLPNRMNVVISRQKGLKISGCHVYESIEHAFEVLATGIENVFVIGGGEIYKQVLPYTDVIQMTLFKLTNPHQHGDVYFPELQLSDWDIECVGFSECDTANFVKYTRVHNRQYVRKF